MTSELAEKLFIAFAGAAVALILKAIYDEIKESIQRTAFRKAIEHNINDVLIPKTERLITDYEQVRKVVLAPNREAYELQTKEQLDWMPMLNSDLLKRLPPQEVYRCLTDKRKYGLLFEAFYAIDWHKEKMPKAILDYFYKKNLEHFEQERDHLENEDHIDHLFRCAYASALRDQVDNEITLRVGSAKEVLSELKKLSTL